MKFSSLKCVLGKYKGKLIKFALVYPLFCSLPGFAQSIDNLNIEKVQGEGLTNESINCINQDTKGFLWFGTGEGLFRYDGYSFTAIKNFPGDSSTLADNLISCLYPDHDHLWVGTVNGLSCLDINTLAIKNFPATKFLQINAIYPKNDSLFWFTTSKGLYLFNRMSYRLRPAGVIEGNLPLNSLTDDKKGHLYFTSIYGFYYYTIKTNAVKFYPLDLPTHPNHDKNARLVIGRSAMDNNGNIWLGTWDAGLVRFDPKTQKTATWFHPTDDVHQLPYKIVMGILPDSAGNIWLANKEGGLTIFNPSKNKFINYPVEWNDENKISDPVGFLFRDKSGIIWIGTENGIFKYDPHHIYLSKTYLYQKRGAGMVPAHISPITMFKDKDGLWWLGMYEGLFTYDEKTGAITDCNDAVGLPKQFTFAVFNVTQDAGGTIWATAKNLLVKIIKRSNKTFKTEIYKSDNIKSTLYNLFIDHENRMWIGTHSEGIYRFDPETKKFISCNYNVVGPLSKINEIRTFCELSKDSMLIGGAHTGLLLLHTNTGRYERIRLAAPKGTDADYSIGAIYKTGKDIWIGTDDNGLWQTNTSFAKPAVEDINDGLPSMSIGPIASDRMGNIWFLSNAGVVRLEIKDKKITVFDKRDGIQNQNELYTLMVDSNNIVSFGTRGAVYRFNPAKIVRNEAPPKVLITNLRIFDKDYPIRPGETARLGYNQNYFTFEYVALNYTQSRLNKYAYQMAGLDKKWNYAGSRRYVSYANLDEGTYTFYVKACNNEGVWNNTPAKFTLIIAPPFWHRWWFYMSIIALVIGSVYALYWYNMNQFKMRLQLRSKIARDLHDDIGSTLSGINIFSKIALQKLKHNEAGSGELLEKISDRSEKTMDALSDIVWSISTRNDHIDNFLVKAREYLAETLEPQGIRYDMQIDDDITHLKLGMELRKEFYLIFKEAICNASKYARCTLIEIFLTKEKDVVSLSIRDNGKGFDISKVTSGNGLQNMQHRAEKMNAKLAIVSRQDQGTSIMLSFRIPRFR
ncbi:MAG TPA: two-component regulator propeller domain-containing protein [Mucilaginibacter sp.]|jgi:ligand-binding sensor domain-containing protein/two-component sensor histidine kinase|nr:two-component regulator propeller domain-containing protein [Mucilaginibacter sp.]